MFVTLFHRDAHIIATPDFTIFNDAVVTVSHGASRHTRCWNTRYVGSMDMQKRVHVFIVLVTPQGYLMLHLHPFSEDYAKNLGFALNYQFEHIKNFILPCFQHHNSKDIFIFCQR